VKDSAIRVLRNTSSGSLKDPQATENLKQALLKEINSTLTSGKVTGLYFEEFIVQ
jgi:flagellar basal body-associated protein FliL